jgi:hypothetical protein
VAKDKAKKQPPGKSPGKRGKKPAGQPRKQGRKLPAREPPATSSEPEPGNVRLKIRSFESVKGALSKEDIAKLKAFFRSGEIEVRASDLAQGIDAINAESFRYEVPNRSTKTRKET